MARRPDKITKLAKSIARQLFTFDGPKPLGRQRARRLALMIGPLGGQEHSVGGWCEGAVAHRIELKLRRWLLREALLPSCQRKNLKSKIKNHKS